MMTHKELTYLIEQYAQGTITAEKKAELLSFLADIGLESITDELINDWLTQDLSGNQPDAFETTIQKHLNNIFSTDKDLDYSTNHQSNLVFDEPLTHRVHFLKRWGWAAAAVFILAVGITTAVVVSSDRQPAKSGTDLAQTAASDILPGTNRAVLTVDDKTIDLSSDKTGITVGKNISYTDGERLSDAGKMMLLATPNGGQYQLVLPDGTKAWLNAASSIRFPSVFSEGKRQIKVTGEVYLEVAKDKSKPFFVDVDGKSIVQVLGTRFNVNSYADDASIRTTLVEGSVKVSNLLNAGRSVTLRPGQQALQMAAAASSDQQLTVQAANIEQVLAWKNGLFNFEGASLKDIMLQLSRWYDLNVRYEGAIPVRNFRGKVTRDLNLSQVLKLLETVEVKFRLEGKTLVVIGS